MDRQTVSELLLAHLPRDLGSACPPELRDALCHSLEDCAAAWPNLAIPLAEFMVYLAERIPEDWDLTRIASALKISDLYLACACGRNDPRALEAFEKTFFPEIQNALLRMNLSATLTEDIRQKILQKLFAAAPGATPKIAQYSGRGELRKWVRVVAVREALNALRESKREQLVDEDELGELAVPSDDPELQYLKQTYRDKFKLVFQEALAALSSQERNLLRHHLLDGLSINQIGALYNLHRSTVARRIAKVREKLLVLTRQGIMRQLGVNRAEFDSIIRLIHSQLDASIRRFLK